MQPVPLEIVARLPVPIKVQWPDGTTATYNLPILGTKGLIPWLAERTVVRKAAGRTAMEKVGLTAKIDLFRVEKMIELDEAVIADLAIPAQTPEGIERILKLSIDKSDVPDDKRDQVLAIILDTAYISANLSQYLSTLFQTQEAEQPQGQQQPGGKASPLASGDSGTPRTSAPASGTIGSAAA